MSCSACGYGRAVPREGCRACRGRPPPAPTPPFRISEQCPRCGAALVIRERADTRRQFLGCTNFPSCRFTEVLHLRTARLGRRIMELERELARRPALPPPAKSGLRQIRRLSLAPDAETPADPAADGAALDCLQDK